jgi:hypothetical protein
LHILRHRGHHAHHFHTCPQRDLNSGRVVAFTLDTYSPSRSTQTCPQPKARDIASVSNGSHTQCYPPASNNT